MGYIVEGKFGCLVRFHKYDLGYHDTIHDQGYISCIPGC